MAEELTATTAPPEIPVVSPAAVAPSIDPAEYARMRDELAQWHQFNETASPHADKIQRIINDAEYGDFVDKSYGAYENMRNQSRPPEDETPGWFKPYAQQLDTARESQVRSEKEVQDKWQRDEMDFAARLVAEQPSLKENNGIVRVAAFADSMAKVENRRVGIEEAWKTMQGFNPSAPAPAPSLRADAGAIGIPERAPADNSKFAKDFHGEMLSRLKRAKNAS